MRLIAKFSDHLVEHYLLYLHTTYLLQAKKSKENDEFAAALAEAGVVLADDYVEEKKVNTRLLGVSFYYSFIAHHKDTNIYT